MKNSKIVKQKGGDTKLFDMLAKHNNSNTKTRDCNCENSEVIGDWDMYKRLNKYLHQKSSENGKECDDRNSITLKELEVYVIIICLLLIIPTLWTIRKRYKFLKDLRSIKADLRYIAIYPFDRFAEKYFYKKKIEDLGLDGVLIKPKKHICNICLESFSLNSNTRFLNCQHQYHKECIDSWLRSSPILNCPTCRYQIV